MHGVSSSPQKACQRKAGASLVIVAHGIPNAVRQPIAALAPAATGAATCPTRAFRSFTAAVNRSQLPGVSACRSLALKGEVLVGLDDGEGDVVYEMFSEPSHDLRELCSAQLRQLFAVISRLSPVHSSCKACVYARRADSFNSPQIKLQQVACWPSKAHNPGLWTAAAAAGVQQSSSNSGGSSSCSSFEELDDLLILHTPPWEPGSSSGSSSGNGVGCDTEASLCQEEVVLLPSSNMLVLPLAEAGVLVGLLVVELATSSGSSSLSVVEPVGVAGRDGNLNAGTGPQQQQQQQSWAAAGLPEDALWCLRNAVLPLAKGCAMDLRQALTGAQHEAQQRLARSLLDEVQGPLKVLGTFGQMLAPRLRAEEGKEPESDMAEGIVLQGQRLADVVQQLEAALRPGAAAAAARLAGRQQLPRQQLLALPWSASTTAAAAGVDLGPAEGDEASQLGVPNQLTSQEEFSTGSQEQPWALSGKSVSQLQVAAGAGAGIISGLVPAVAASNSGRLPEHCSSSNSSSSSSSKVVAVAADDAIVHLPGQGTAASLVASSRNIRWGGVQSAPRSDPTPAPTSLSTATAASTAAAPAAAAPAAAPAADGRTDSIGISFTAGNYSGSGSSSSSGGPRCDAFYSPAGDAFDVDKTIELVEESGSGEGMGDVEPGAPCSLGELVQPDASGLQAANSSSSSSSSGQLSSCSSSSSSSSSSSVLSSVVVAGGAVPLEQQQPRHQQRSGSCNVLEVLGGLLSAAAQLAAVQEVNLIANDPLQLDASSSAPATTSSSRTSDSAATAAVLLPLPWSAKEDVGDAASTAAVDASSSSHSTDSTGADGSESDSSSTYTLLPRPVRPLLVGIAAATCKRVLGYVLDVALQCTPRGGQLWVSARQSAGGVEVKVLHTGQASPSRLHTTRQGLGTAGAPTVAAAAGPVKDTFVTESLLPGRVVSLGQASQQQQQQIMLAAGPRGGRSSSSRAGRGLQELAATPSPGGSSSSSRLVSLDFATQLLQAVGGRLSVAYPEQFMNAVSGRLEVGSSIEVWLPPPAPAC